MEGAVKLKCALGGFIYVGFVNMMHVHMIGHDVSLRRI